MAAQKRKKEIVNWYFWAFLNAYQPKIKLIKIRKILSWFFQTI